MKHMATDLLIISPGFPESAEDDTCIPPLQEYLWALLAQRPGLRVAVIALQYPYTDVPYDWCGVRVFPCNGRNSRARRLFAQYRAWKHFDRLKGEGAIGCVHGLWLGQAAALAERMSVKADASAVVTLMGQDARDNTRWLRHVGKSTALVCLSARHANVLRSNSDRSPTSVIPWGSPPQMSSMVPTKRITDMLFVGSHIPVKQPKVFEEVFQDVADQRSVEAKMVGGDGVQDEANPPGTMPKVELQYAGSRLGQCARLPRTEVFKEMLTAKLLVHTSVYESQGYVFDEALAAGMSIVSFPVGSAAARDRWRVVENSVEMTAAVIDLLDHPPGNIPITLHPMRDTLNAYLTLYGLD
jgi:1,2-diacylglycerol 3-alpha-glucosyltransferase